MELSDRSDFMGKLLSNFAEIEKHYTYLNENLLLNKDSEDYKQENFLQDTSIRIKNSSTKSGEDDSMDVNDQ